MKSKTVGELIKELEKLNKDYVIGSTSSNINLDIEGYSWKVLADGETVKSMRISRKIFLPKLEDWIRVDDEEEIK